jgi:hypothetical protein
VFDGEVAGVHVVVGSLEADEAAEFDEGLGVVVYPQIKEAVGPGLAGGLGLDDDEGGGLSAADVAAGALGRVEGGEHAFGEVAPRGLEGARHGGPDARVRHHVGLHGVVLAGVVAGGLDAFGAGVRGDAAAGVNHRHLPHVAPLVARE